MTSVMMPPSLTYPPRPAHYHGFCWGCCRPAETCCCGHPQCRREAKELLVEPKLQRASVTLDQSALDLMKEAAAAKEPVAGVPAAAVPQSMTKAVVTVRSGSAGAFIGGGCCVHLSVEYMPLSPLEIEVDPKTGVSFGFSASVTVTVEDSEGTQLTWKQTTGANSVYQVRENIITTKPGAKLTVSVDNMIARVRWCEVFSC